MYNRSVRLVKIAVRKENGKWHGNLEDGSRIDFPDTVRTRLDVFMALGHPEGSREYYCIRYED